MNGMSPWPAIGITLLALGTALVLVGKSSPKSRPTAGFASVDGLRGYLAFAVFLHHAAVWFGYLRTGRWAPPPSNFYVHLGQCSVMLFFMITGLLFWSKLLNGDIRPICWSKLYISRVLRLAPLYTIAVVGLSLAAYWAAGFHVREPVGRLVSHVGQWLAFTFPGTPEINRFAETSMLLGVAWTLRYEWLFYAFLPLGALVLRRVPAPLWIVVSLVATAAIYYSIPGINRIMLLAFGSGMLAAVLVRIEAIRCRLQGKVFGGLVALTLPVIASIFSTAYCLPVLAMLSVAFVCIACGNSVFGVLHWKSSKQLGEMAYSIYLLHNLLLFITFRCLLGNVAPNLSPMTHWLVIGGLVPVLIALCQATFRLIELPSMVATARIHAWLVSLRTPSWTYSRRAKAGEREVGQETISPPRCLYVHCCKTEQQMMRFSPVTRPTECALDN
jgi:peptidoglycan/LPS O-acetylase OafA/YrhL